MGKGPRIQGRTLLKMDCSNIVKREEKVNSSGLADIFLNLTLLAFSEEGNFSLSL
jgi:hypothetical protein